MLLIGAHVILYTVAGSKPVNIWVEFILLTIAMFTTSVVSFTLSVQVYTLLAFMVSVKFTEVPVTGLFMTIATLVMQNDKKFMLKSKLLDIVSKRT